jgi:hypothetical protein
VSRELVFSDTGLPAVRMCREDYFYGISIVELHRIHPLYRVVL